MSMWRIAVVCTSVAVALVACGGGGARLGAHEFTRESSMVCERANRTNHAHHDERPGAGKRSHRHRPSGVGGGPARPPPAEVVGGDGRALDRSRRPVARRARRDAYGAPHGPAERSRRVCREGRHPRGTGTRGSRATTTSHRVACPSSRCRDRGDVQPVGLGTVRPRHPAVGTASGRGRRTRRRRRGARRACRAPRSDPRRPRGSGRRRCIVDSRCAITSEVRPSSAVSSACWTATSDSESRCAVASSRTTTRGAFSSSRAIAMRCFSPPEKPVAAVADDRVEAVGQRVRRGGRICAARERVAQLLLGRLRAARRAGWRGSCRGRGARPA